MIRALAPVEPVLVRRRRRSDNSKLLSSQLRHVPTTYGMQVLSRSVTVTAPILALLGQTYESTQQNVHNRVGNISRTSAPHLFTKHADRITDSESRKNPRRKFLMDGPRSPHKRTTDLQLQPAISAH